MSCLYCNIFIGNVLDYDCIILYDKTTIPEKGVNDIDYNIIKDTKSTD